MVMNVPITQSRCRYTTWCNTVCVCVFVSVSADQWLYDVGSRQWRDLGVSHDPPRLWHTATSFNNGEVIIFGGCHDDILNHDIIPVCSSSSSFSSTNSSSM